MLATISLIGKTPYNFIEATGGDVDIGIVGDYKYHVFNASKTGPTDGFHVLNAGNGATANLLEYMVVGAGGGGGTSYGGGGGAGGYRAGTGLIVTKRNYQILIESGGALATVGGVSKFDTDGSSEVVADGGGAGGSNSVGGNGASGGGGGKAQGSEYGSILGGDGVYDAGQTLGHVLHQGRDGGIGVASGTDFENAHGGGGGASAVGQDGSGLFAGDGGAGVENLIGTDGHGDSGYYCGGGGGGGDYHHTGGGTNTAEYRGVGGVGGGGDAGGSTSSPYASSAGAPNTGGGGAGVSAAGQTAGTIGGSGIVILRYKFQ